ncbi:MAG: hypothetical protein J6P37_09255 [Lachnospiraceae bacterium]|nr:hypothetical protein [Lachnospiraceae bacterium]
MKTNFKLLLTTITFFAMAFMFFRISAKAEGEPIKIYTADDLLAISENTYADYVLMNDIDMAGIDWTPVDYFGNFDGNNHAILNLSVKYTSNEIRTTYDGNYKTYDTCFAGLFGVLEKGSVKNLTLKGINVKVNKEEPCFIGSIAGFAEGSSIENCNIEGTLRLDVSAKMFGVGGIVGYGGDGSITSTNADVTLICIDHDRENRDEQFMGGGYSAGYLDVDKCFIKIDGYDSDHGYVHDGGLVGMYILYPLGNNYPGYINNTRVEGMITFFEDNTDRRAYCKDFIGEVMNWTYEYVGNSSDFTRNEIKDYSKDLLPHYCEGNNYSKETVESTCDDFGYTVYKCNDCGEYSYKADYTLKNHKIDEWSVVEEATTEKEGLSKGVCSTCGAEVYIITPVVVEKANEIEEKAVTEIVTEPETVPEKEPIKEEEGDTLLKVFLIGGLVICIGLVAAIAVVLLRGRKKR